MNMAFTGQPQLKPTTAPAGAFRSIEMNRYMTKAKKHSDENGSGYLVTITDSQGIYSESKVYIEYVSCMDSGTGWRIFHLIDGCWECHEYPSKTKREAILHLQIDGSNN